jgi:hypothetical protein
VELAARACSVPLALLGVPDGERLRLRACLGISPESIPLPSPLLERLFEAPALMVLSNLAADKRLAGDPVARRLGAQAVLGARVTTAEGLVVGALLLASSPLESMKYNMDFLSRL